ncbi:MAG: gamma-glutamyl-gamma-aminobutyrate hydrolase family protein [Candidatus Saccharimonadales bacterium]|nr:gamma-glutamyl-gamma-aminobutyrate hydrolase family protein [Candidatus Saccharimonadales bacterium]
MIAIIQSRTDKSVQHEKECFEKYLPYEELEFLSVFDDKEKISDAAGLMEQYEKIIIAGSAELLISRKDPQTQEAISTILPTLKRLIEADFPTLGICFGHQLIGMALGGVIAKADSQAEGGVQRIRFTDAGWSDPIFDGLHNPLSVSEGHHDSVVVMPKEVIHLAYSDRCPSQAFRVGNNIYGVQFHPELTLDDMEERWRVSVPYHGARVNVGGKRNHGPAIMNNFVSMPV